VQIIGNLFRSSGALEESVTAQKKVTVEKDSRWHQKASKNQTPWGRQPTLYGLWVRTAKGLLLAFLPKRIA
jgi:hypothetical protein